MQPREKKEQNNKIKKKQEKGTVYIQKVSQL